MVYEDEYKNVSPVTDSLVNKALGLCVCFISWHMLYYYLEMRPHKKTFRGESLNCETLHTGDL